MSRWQHIIEPLSTSPDPQRRRQTRLLARLLTFVIPLGLLSATVQLIVVPGFFYTFLAIIGAEAILSVAYGLNRAGRYTPAAILIVAMPSLASFASLVTNPTDYIAFSFLLIGVLFSSILLTLRGTVVVAVTNVVGLLILPMLAPAWTYPEILGPLGLNVIFPALIVVAMRHRDLIETDRQAELRESEERYRLLIETMNDGLATMDEHMITTFVNDTFCRMIGYERDELIGKPVFNFLVEADQQVIKTRAPQRQRDDNSPYELTIPRKDGELLFVRISPSTIRDAAGRFIGSLAVITDITKRKRAEEALRYTEQRYRNLFEEAPLMYVITESRAAIPFIVDCNELFNSTLGYRREEVLDQPLADFYTPITRVALLEEGGYERALAGTFVVEERQLLARDGRVIETLLYGVPEIDTAGHVWGTRAMYVDITERKRAEEALQTSRKLTQTQLAELSHLYKTIPVGLCLMDTDLRFVRINEQLAQINGKPIAAHLGKTLKEVIPEITEMVEPIYRRVLASGEPALNFALHGTAPAEPDVPRDWLVSYYPHTSEEGAMLGVSTVVQDITELRRLEKEILEISNYEQRRMGHDLHDSAGQILAGTGFLISALQRQLQKKELPEAAQAEEIGRRVGEALAQARALARGLSPVGMEHGGLRQALQDLARDTEEISGIGCTFTCPFPVLLDDLEVATHVYYIAQEALNNAAKHSDASCLNVALTRENAIATLTIRDNGIGIPELDRPGKGMGLRIMQHRANMINATFKMEDSPEGGTLVTCRFPINPV